MRGFYLDPSEPLCYKRGSPNKEVRMAQKLWGRLAVLSLASQLFLAVHTLPLQADEGSAERTQKGTVAETQASEGVQGVASYYAKRYNGRKTSSGARYRPDKLTAAHPDLPLGTKVKVINLTNGKDVVVTINDRCSKKAGRAIDLSRAAAQQLGILRKGMAQVRIIPLNEEPT
jgi:rare lipoprotein A